MKQFAILLMAVLVAAPLAAPLAAESITAIYSVGISHEAKRVSGETVARDVGKFRVSTGFDAGTATDDAQIDTVWSVQAQVSSSSAVSYDLQSLAGKFGDTLVFERVKFFGIHNLDGTDTLRIGSGTTPWAFGQATQTVVTIPPYGSWCQSGPLNGWDASVTARLINIESTAGLASFDLVIGGVR